MGLFSRKYVVSKVGDRDVAFFPLSFPVLFKLKSAVGPAAKVIVGLFSGAKKIVGRFQEDSRDKDGAPVRVVQEQPISAEMFKLQAEQQAKVVNEVIEVLFADQNRLLLGHVLMDSMRNEPECPRHPDVRQIESFVSDLDLGQVVEMLQGVVKANVEVFGPLVRGWVEQVLTALRAQASSVSPTSRSPEPLPQTPPGPQLVPKD